MYYRQAVQLDPDVEFKAYRKTAKNGTITNIVASSCPQANIE